MDEEKSIEIARRLLKVRARYPELDEVSSAFMHNYQNAHNEIINMFRRMDSDIRDDMMLRVYKEALSFPELEEVGYFSDVLTDFGERLVEIRFCCGYVGNLVQGDRLPEEQCAALMFAYECYWREGENFLLGNVVENLLRRIESPDTWKWPEDRAFKGKEENRQIQWLAHAVAKEMKELARHHRSKQPAWDNFKASPKPELKDFRGTLGQIKDAAKAERATKAASPGKRSAGAAAS